MTNASISLPLFLIGAMLLAPVSGCSDHPSPDQFATDTTVSGSAQTESTVVTEADEAENKTTPEPPQTDFEAYLSRFRSQSLPVTIKGYEVGEWGLVDALEMDSSHIADYVPRGTGRILGRADERISRQAHFYGNVFQTDNEPLVSIHLFVPSTFVYLVSYPAPDEPSAPIRIASTTGGPYTVRTTRIFSPDSIRILDEIYGSDRREVVRTDTTWMRLDSTGTFREWTSDAVEKAR